MFTITNIIGWLSNTVDSLTFEIMVHVVALTICTCMFTITNIIGWLSNTVPLSNVAKKKKKKKKFGGYFSYAVYGNFQGSFICISGKKSTGDPVYFFCDCNPDYSVS